MKIFAVTSTYSYWDKGEKNDTTIFPRAFRTESEAIHAIEEDFAEMWTEMTGDSFDTCDQTPNVMRMAQSDKTNVTGTIILNMGDDANITWEIRSLDFE